jgi:hypothetical protein
MEPTQSTFQDFLHKNEKIIGSIASILAIVMFVSLIEVLLANLRGQTAIVIQPLATFLNGFFWSLYAYGRRDWFLLGPNVLACVLGALTAGAAFI